MDLGGQKNATQHFREKWLRWKVSNFRHRCQRPVYYRYTTPHCCLFFALHISHLSEDTSI